LPLSADLGLISVSTVTPPLDARSWPAFANNTLSGESDDGGLEESAEVISNRRFSSAFSAYTTRASPASTLWPSRSAG
jgi:hypothetical protein